MNSQTSQAIALSSFTTGRLPSTGRLLGIDRLLTSLALVAWLAAVAPTAYAECNVAPQAQTDEVSVLDLASVLIDPLANDFDPDGQPLALQYLGDTCFGSVAVSGETLTYQPLAGVAESCSIAYRAIDSSGASASSAIAVTVSLFEPVVFGDGFEGGSTAQWSATVVE